jgi:hypothetical protein
MRRLKERVGAICELRVQTATKLDLKRLAIYTVGIVIGSEQISCLCSQSFYRLRILSVRVLINNFISLVK